MHEWMGGTADWTRRRMVRTTRNCPISQATCNNAEGASPDCVEQGRWRSPFATVSLCPRRIGIGGLNTGKQTGEQIIGYGTVGNPGDSSFPPQ